MSANLLAGYAPYLANGTVAGPVSYWVPAVDLWTAPAYSAASTIHRDVIQHITDKGNFPKLSKLTANQSVTISAGFQAASTSFKANLIHLFVRYTDAAGNPNWIFVSDSYSTITTGNWLRVSGTVTVPSGMTVTGCGIAQYGGAGKAYMTALSLSYGSGVPLAEETFTPFETASHAQTEYATYASQKILSDSITSEVKARAKTDGAVSELSTTMEQTVKGINVSLDKLTDTDKQIRSWFDFGTDPSGNPKLAMGSSSSPIIGEYSNTGTTYKDRSGATLLALDAANSTTGADHVVAKDMTVGKWQWVPTNGGTHLTLMWRG